MAEICQDVSTTTAIKLTSRAGLQMNVTVTLYVKKRDNLARVCLSVIDELTMDTLLETLYIDRCIQYILPIERQIVPAQSKPMSIISV